MHRREWAKLKSRGRKIGYSIFFPIFENSFSYHVYWENEKTFYIIFFYYDYKLLRVSFSAYFSAPLRSDVAGRLSSSPCHAGARDEHAPPVGVAQGNLLCSNSLSFLDVKSRKVPRRKLGRSVLKKTRQPGSPHHCMEQSPPAPHHQRRQDQDNVNSPTNGGLRVRALNVILANVPPMHGSNSNALLGYQLLL